MTALSDTQLVILQAACARPDHLALPLPANLRGGAASKVVNALIHKALLEEVDAGRNELMWRETGDGHGQTLVATLAAFEALGIDIGSPKAKKPKAPRETKQNAIFAMLREPAGASAAEIGDKFGWLQHTTRAFVAIAKKKGATITAEKIEGRGTVYRIDAA